MEERGLTPEEFLAIGERLKSMEGDTTPFPVVDGKKISVVGDANRTEVKRNDYEIKFRIPKEMLGNDIPKGAQQVGDFYAFTVKYKDISVTPRNDLKIVDAIFKLLPFFRKLKDDGSVEEMGKEELFSMFAYANEEIHLAMYNLVATFLGINDRMGEYMLPMSVIHAVVGIMDAHPEIFNEADVFFG